ncbi:phosphatidylserine decarboxylase, partial [Reticulomyxa filosa]
GGFNDISATLRRGAIIIITSHISSQRTNMFFIIIIIIKKIPFFFFFYIELFFLLKKISLFTHFYQDKPKMKDENNGLYYVIMYLNPGDYHRFHMSCDMRVERMKHMPGYLYAVKPSWLNKVPGLFSLNERVVIEGTWNPSLQVNNDWYFSYTPVGALCVGNIVIHFDSALTTNDHSHDSYLWFYRNGLTQPLPQVADSKHRTFLPYQTVGGVAAYTHGFEHSYDPFFLEKGEEVGYFTFGSTVVLIFEAAKFQWCIERGQKIKFGEAMGEIVMS